MEVVIAPNNKLRTQTKLVKKVTPELKRIINEMIELTKTYTDPQGVGLASTQVGRDEQLFVALQKDKSFKVFINPKIVSYSKRKKLMLEGCLSIPNFWGKIERPIAVTVTYMDINGKQIRERLTGLAAHIFQHEVDHLSGKLFMDIVMEQRAKLYKVVGKDKYGEDIWEAVPL
jgi:peptide deformylase